MLGYNSFIHHLKNIPGKKIQRKVIVFAVDDYGNVRVDSRNARERMNNAGLKIQSRFDAFDSLETREDLEMLYETLCSVKDDNGNHAVFSPLALPCNINFEQIIERGYDEYTFELLPETYSKLEALQPHAYRGAWDLWCQGIREGILAPQFHGREHLNIKVFNEKLRVRDYEVLVALENRSYASITSTEYKTISYTAAFQFWDFVENKGFESIISTGLDAFEKVFGYKATVFNAPAGGESTYIYRFLKDGGIKFIEVPMLKNEHLGYGKYKRVFNYTGKKSDYGQMFLVRNCVFEPTSNDRSEWVNYALKQIEAAFNMGRPAIISSHRVNFCGHIDPLNRRKGLNDLKRLLKALILKWPNVEFISLSTLGDILYD